MAEPTETSKLKVVILTHGGAELLIGSIAAIPQVEISGVVVETGIKNDRPLFQRMKRSIRYDGYPATLRKLLAPVVGKSQRQAEIENIQGDRESTAAFAESLGLSVFMVNNYHAERSLGLLGSLDPDLGIIYGTNIVRASVFDLPRLGSVNVHQGLVPFYRGGPSVFWELFNGEEVVGITIHRVAAKVDAGDVLLQKTVPLEYDFSKYSLDYDSFLSDFRRSLRKPASEMMADVVKTIASGKINGTKQDLSLGKRYRLPTMKEKNAMKRILRERYAKRPR